MTTVAYRDGVLASDGRITSSGSITSDRFRKVFKLTDGRLVGISGTVCKIDRVIKFLEEGGPAPETPDAAIMVINQRGGIALIEEGTFLIVPEPFSAIGSGKGVALGALHAGASAVDAVKAAMKVDVYSGGRVFTAEL